MDQTVKFTPLDMQKWPRGQMFYYFSKMAPTGYSLTVDLDVTAMRTAVFVMSTISGASPTL